MNDHSTDRGDGCSLEGRRRECSGDKMDWGRVGWVGRTDTVPRQHTTCFREEEEEEEENKAGGLAAASIANTATA